MNQGYSRLLSLLIILGLTLCLAGCAKVKKWAGFPDEDAPPESVEEEVVIDGKTYVKSRNPYYLTYPEQPEFIYAEKGTEFYGMQDYLVKSLAKEVAKEKKKAGATVPPDQLQELVRQEVERVLREQGLGGMVYASRVSGAASVYPGRAMAVIPALSETPSGYEGLNRTLAVSAGTALQKQKDLLVVDEGRLKSAIGKVTRVGKLATRENMQALGDALGVQGIIITRIVPPEKGTSGFMVMELYDTFLGNKVKSIVEPAGEAGLNMDTVNRFAQRDAYLLAGELRTQDWFGRVEFIQDDKVYLNLGLNTGLKVGDRLKVVQPGKEITNPATHASLGFTADTTQGEVKVAEIIGNNAAAATILSGGPFKPNDKVKAD
ncbi:MAG: hypothetical protein PHW74_14705 [Desulfobacca sp.]|nr:hypothetical protein [Desulfobacca sp.]